MTRKSFTAVEQAFIRLKLKDLAIATIPSIPPKQEIMVKNKNVE